MAGRTAASVHATASPSSTGGDGGLWFGDGGGAGGAGGDGSFGLQGGNGGNGYANGTPGILGTLGADLIAHRVRPAL
jgi:hypothetical protein